MRTAIRDWALFGVVHLVLIAENLFAPNGPLGDVLFTYPTWIYQGLVGNGWQGLTAPGVYPMLALIPMFCGAFGWGWWFLFVVIANGVAFGVARHRARVAALVWLAFLALLGPIAVGRIDVLTVALGVIVIVVADSHPRAAGILVAVATWAVTSAVSIGLIGLLIGGWSNVTAFLGDQQGRGIQVESVVATPWLWDAAAGGFSAVVYSQELLTFEVHGPSTELVASLVTLIELIVLGLVAARIVVHRVRMVGEITTHILGLSLTTLIVTLIVFAKVGSPQFVSWLGVAVVALVVYWHPRWSPPLLGLIATVALLTHIVYPYVYFDLLSLEPGPLVLLTLRNVVEVALFVVATTALWRELRLEELANQSGDRDVVDEEGVVPERG